MGTSKLDDYDDGTLPTNWEGGFSFLYVLDKYHMAVRYPLGKEWQSNQFLTRSKSYVIYSGDHKAPERLRRQRQVRRAQRDHIPFDTLPLSSTSLDKLLNVINGEGREVEEDASDGNFLHCPRGLVFLGLQLSRAWCWWWSSEHLELLDES